MGRLAAAVVVTIATGCQVYDFEPVSPDTYSQTRVSRRFVVRGIAPEIVVLLDRSRSMELPVDELDARCPAGCGAAGASLCPAACPTRMSELRGAMDTFLADPLSSRMRWSLAAFPATPEPSSCEASSSFVRPLIPLSFDDESAEVQGQRELIARDVRALPPGGGTPTAPSLDFVREALEGREGSRERFVVLLTDGLPNCNAANPNAVCVDRSAAQLERCGCTNGSASACDNAFACSKGCLDRSAIDAVARLAAVRVPTFVVGFGADTGSGAAREVLGAMARAGRTARFCEATADCKGSGVCGADHLCTVEYYQASRGSQLRDAFQFITEVLPHACEVLLDEPISNPALVTVIDDTGAPYPRDQWSIGADQRRIVLEGALCTRVHTSDAAHPVFVEVRIVEAL